MLASDNSRQMPFTTSSILKNESCLVAIKADSPTVTMPRIKVRYKIYHSFNCADRYISDSFFFYKILYFQAITSGISSTYVDVLLNFMSSHFEEENFVTNAILNGLKVLFYGDDTWLKLFPSAFLRSEGTNSFFALDFTEVDTNVTRHIDKELGRDDWDIIILHYLGLDHIGHLEGPKSPLVKPKLKEMDDVIKKISNHLKMLVSINRLEIIYQISVIFIATIQS